MAIPVIIGAGLVAAGAIGTAVSGGLSRTNAGWADDSGYRNAAAMQGQAVGQYGSLANAYLNRQGPQLGNASMMNSAQLGPAAQYGGATIDPNADAASRAMQSQLAAKLTGQMNGTEPSLAQLQMQQGLAANLKAQQSAAASMRGGAVNASLAMRNLGDQGASSRQALVGQSGIARLQEQQGAMSQLGGLSSSMRSQDFGNAFAQAQMKQQAGMFNAGQLNQFGLAQGGFDQQRNLANTEAMNKFAMGQYQGDLQMTGMNDQATSNMLGLQQKSMDSQLDGSIAQQGNWYKGQEAMYKSSEDAKKKKLAFWGGIMGAGGNLMGMSDERQKTDIEDETGLSENMAKVGKGMGSALMGGGQANASAGALAAMSDERQKSGVGSPELRSFYDNVGAHSYEYKDPSLPGAGEGRFVSPMAQELEKSSIGKSMVKDTPDGKIVDYAKGFGAMLAGQAEFHDRLKRLEAALSAKKGNK